MADWTGKDKHALRIYWRQRMTAAEIAKHLDGDFTRNAVIGKAHRLGLEKRPSPLPPKSIALPIVKAKNEAYAGNGYQFGKAKRGRAPNTSKTKRDETRDKINTTAYGEACKMEDLGAKQCRWPIGEDADVVFCGEKTFKGSYCEKHHTISKQGKMNVEKYIKPHSKR